MKLFFVFIASIILISCANLMGSVSGGFYTSVNSEFKVKTPSIPKLSVDDGILNQRVFVDFYQSRGFWKKYGLYSIEWYKPEKILKSDETFYLHNKNATPALVKNNFGTRGTFNVVDTRELKVNQAAAYQFIANGILDNVDAVWVGTSIKFNNHIALVSLVIYSEFAMNTELHGASVQTNIPWDKYKTFLHSFTSLKSH